MLEAIAPMMNLWFHGWVAMGAGIAAIYVSVSIVAALMDRPVSRWSFNRLVVFGLVTWAFFGASLAVITPNAKEPWLVPLLTCAFASAIAIPNVCMLVGRL